MELMKDWDRSLFLILLAITFIEMLLPESSMGKYLLAGFQGSCRILFAEIPGHIPAACTIY